MVSALISGSSGPSSSPGQGHCVVFLGKTLYSHSASLHPRVQMGTGEFNTGSNPAMDQHPNPRGKQKLFLVASCYRNWDKLRPDGSLGYIKLLYYTCRQRRRDVVRFFFLFFGQVQSGANRIPTCGNFYFSCCIRGGSLLVLKRTVMVSAKRDLDSHLPPLYILLRLLRENGFFQQFDIDFLSISCQQRISLSVYYKLILNGATPASRLSLIHGMFI